MIRQNLRLFRRSFNVVVLTGLLLLFTRTAAPGEESVLSAVDTIWVLIAAFLVFFMQGGFCFLEAGFVRSKNVVNMMAENLMDTRMTTLGFIILGFGLMFGTSNGLSGISPQWQRPRRTPVGALPAGMIS
ncbi:MAG: hypothetical protein R6X18_09485 [Chloroflexota bacterium]